MAYGDRWRGPRSGRDWDRRRYGSGGYGGWETADDRDAAWREATGYARDRWDAPARGGRGYGAYRPGEWDRAREEFERGRDRDRWPSAMPGDWETRSRTGPRWRGEWGGGRDGWGGPRDDRSMSEMAFGSDDVRDYRPGDFSRRYEPEERGFFERAGDEVASWFGDDEAERRRDRDEERYARSHRGRGPKTYQRSDDRIREDVNDRLTDDSWLDASDIEVAVSGREVTLSGHVRSRRDKRRAEDIADSVSGVTHVQNNLRVRGEAAGTWPAGPMPVGAETDPTKPGATVSGRQPATGTGTETSGAGSAGRQGGRGTGKG